MNHNEIVEKFDEFLNTNKIEHLVEDNKTIVLVDGFRCGEFNKKINSVDVFKKLYPDTYKNMLNEFFDEIHPY